MKRTIRNTLVGIAALAAAAGAQAAPERYALDPAHTFITFEVSHIGFSWMPGVFREFEGSIIFDPDDPSASRAEFTVKTASLTTFHAERDKHLRERPGLFEVAAFPEARFVSTGYERTGSGEGLLHGELTIKGRTRPVTFKVQEMAARKDPWGNFRRAFSAETEVRLTDFGITFFADNKIPVPTTARIRVAVEALRQ
ncbi:YceI family protein [Inmirania thermothiophila]|uniref:Polyisoprenoid-binding protein YceI n=1 Tax=Inmirania thermothiophila TaxID=1750597 RepID=A0A3N1Y0M1_9GAMM|nr:YceI family protein [Inmirania thermothiophila]ROR32384.1 polyisoprenoid-binding protein YceI [Inmirania thermothiophila]